MPDDRSIRDAEMGVIEDAVHRYPVRVHYCDTDAAGVVYHARYLDLAERARTEMLRCVGMEGYAIGAPGGAVMAVRHCTIDFEAPARLGDLLEIVSRVTHFGGASFELEQKFRRGDRILVTILLRLVCIDAEFRAVRVPVAVRQAFTAGSDGSADDFLSPKG